MAEGSKGMFTALYEAETPASPSSQPGSNVKQLKPPAAPKPASASMPAPVVIANESLKAELEDLSLVGYNAHSYRFTSAEIRWLRRFSNKAGDALDRPISHNTMVRVLFRLADEEWNRDPKSNRLFKLLSKLPVKQ